MTATKEQLQALLERVEAATGPDRELDARIAAILEPSRFDAPGFTPIRPIPEFRYDSGEDAIRFDSGGIMDVRFFPPVATSIDAALALVERVAPGGLLDLTLGYEPGAADRAWPAVTLRFYPDGVRVDGKQYHAVIEGAPTPPLALLAALLKALIAQAEA